MDYDIIYKDAPTYYISFRGINFEYKQQCEKNNDRGNHIICDSKVVPLDNHLGGVINKLVIYFNVLMDQFNVIIRTHKDKYFWYNGYLVEILSELLQYPQLRYGKIMNHTLFEEPNDGSGMNKTFHKLKKGIRYWMISWKIISEYECQ